MAADSGSISSALPQSTSRIHEDTDLPVDHSVQIAVCALCQKAPSPDNEVTSDFASNGVCGDCKFLILEDFGTPAQSSLRRRGGNFRCSFESVENILSQQLYHMVNAVRQNQSIASAEDVQLVDVDTPALLLHSTSIHTTTSGSRRQVFSDTDSDGFDNWSSLYGENESSASFRRYRVPHGETDSFSFSACGDESDVSMDRDSLISTEMFNLPGEGDEFDSDTEIDPMHAGLSQWNSDDMEEEEEEEGEWEVADAEEAEATAHLRFFFSSRPSESSAPSNWEQRFNSFESEGISSQRIRDSWQVYNDHSFTNLEEIDLPAYGANFGDYLDAIHFEDLLAENNSRRGAPPAAVSFVNSLPLVVISEEHGKNEELACAICKDVLIPGIEVNQLPCSHLYHPCCILPWLSARNSCPLCRYELPTDDKDYEKGKWNVDARNEIRETQQLDVIDDSSSDVSDGAGANEEDGSSQTGTQPRELVSMGPLINPSEVRGGRGRWFFLAAAPIVSLVGIVLVLWFGNPLIEGSRLGRHNLPEQNQYRVHVSASPILRENRSRRWWCLF